MNDNTRKKKGGLCLVKTTDRSQNEIRINIQAEVRKARIRTRNGPRSVRSRSAALRQLGLDLAEDAQVLSEELPGEHHAMLIMENLINYSGWLLEEF